MSNAARTHETQSSGRRCNTFEALRWPGENIFSSVFRISQSQILVEPRSLYLGIMQLNNKELKSAALLQYEVARHLGCKQWVNEFRKNCQCDLSDDWIDKNLPSLDGRRLQTSKRSASVYVAESSRDIRLRTEPNINIVRENAAEDRKEETPIKCPDPISYAPKTQGTHTLCKKKRSDPSTSSLRTVSFKKIIPEETPKHLFSTEKKVTTGKTLRKVESSKRSLSVTIDVDEPSLKLKSSQQSEYCLLSNCFSLDSKVRRHCTKRHMPLMFQTVSSDSSNVFHCVQALKWLIKAALGEQATLSDAMETVNQASKIPSTIVLNPLHADYFRQACPFLEVDEPKQFTLHPVNSPAVLLFWRCIMVLLDKCTEFQQKEFVRFKSNPLIHSTFPPKNPSLVLHGSDLELPSNLAECNLPDDSSGMEVAEHSELPAVFDSHFHLDRACKKIWGVEEGHTVEDLLKHSESDSVPYKPAVPVNVIGGIIVYSEPNTYPDVSFTLNGPWKVAVGVHPKQHSTFTEEKIMLLEQLLCHPKVVALGECGLDRSVPPSEWTQQEDVFIKLLKLAKPCIPIVLYLRGPAGDKYGSDVIARCMMLMEVHCRNAQRIHLHCFQGKTDVVKAWLKKFPNTCFGLTASVRTFDSHQIAGLKAIPRTNIVLETDAPYFPFGTAKVSTPAYIGDTAKLVAQHLNVKPEELMEITLQNAKFLYGI